MMRRMMMLGLLAFGGMPLMLAAEDRVPVPATGQKTTEEGSIAPVVRGGELLTTVIPPKYWIGVSCKPVDDALRAQLGLEAGSGLVIDQVMDDSPAKGAGLQVHDLITQAKLSEETHKPADIEQLTKLVQQAETKPLTFSLLRGGKPATITVTPVERSSIPSGPTPIQLDLQNAIVPMGDVLTFRMAGPVVSYAQTSEQPANLPDDITVTFTKSGSQPVEITVHKKDRGEWKAKEKESAVHPQDVSQSVANFLAYLTGMSVRLGTQDGKQTFLLEHAQKLDAPTASQPLKHQPLMVRTQIVPVTTYQPVTKTVQGKQQVQMVPVMTYRAITTTTPATPPAVAPPTLSSLQQRLEQIQKQHEQQREQLTKSLAELRQAVEKLQPKN